MPKTKRHTIIHYILVVSFTLLKSLFSNLIWLIIGLLGYLVFKNIRNPYSIILGLPLILIGVGMIVNNSHTFLLAAFSPKYNKAICFICSTN